MRETHFTFVDEGGEKIFVSSGCRQRKHQKRLSRLPMAWSGDCSALPAVGRGFNGQGLSGLCQ